MDVWRSGAVLPKYSRSRITDTHVVPKTKNTERGRSYNSTPHLLAYLLSDKSFTPAPQMHWPAFGYVAISISSGLAWKSWTFSQFLVNCSTIATPWKSNSSPRLNSIYEKHAKHMRSDNNQIQAVWFVCNRIRTTSFCRYSADIEDRVRTVIPMEERFNKFVAFQNTPRTQLLGIFIFYK